MMNFCYAFFVAENLKIQKSKENIDSKDLLYKHRYSRIIIIDNHLFEGPAHFIKLIHISFTLIRTCASQIYYTIFYKKQENFIPAVFLFLL